jgi:hypothetical protein
MSKEGPLLEQVEKILTAASDCVVSQKCRCCDHDLNEHGHGHEAGCMANMVLRHLGPAIKSLQAEKATALSNYGRGREAAYASIAYVVGGYNATLGGSAGRLDTNRPDEEVARDLVNVVRRDSIRELEAEVLRLKAEVYDLRRMG